MEDSYNRTIDYLRLSVTNMCQLKCIYCRPDNNFLKTEILSTRDIYRIVKNLSLLGIKKVRITGGEPLLRRDIVEIVNNISTISGITDIRITTNALLLRPLLPRLNIDEVKGYNISLDSLNENKYRKITRGGELKEVLSAINELELYSDKEIKINVVLIAGINDDEILDFIKLTKSHRISVRFIELMPIQKKLNNRVVKSDEIIKKFPMLKRIPRDYIGQPSRNYRIDGYIGSIGFISPMTHKFCSECNRIRVLSNGIIRPCLGNNMEYSLQEALNSTDDSNLLSILEKAINNKPKEHIFCSKDFNSKHMNQIGG